MSTFPPLRHIAAGLLACSLAGAAHAEVQSGHIQVITPAVSPGQQMQANLQLRIDQTPDGNYTGAWFSHLWGKLKGVSINVDEGSRWFVVQANQPINAAIGTAANPAVSPFNGSGPAIKVGNDFYLAGLTRVGFDSQVPTVFGWVHLRKDFWGRFKVVDAAVAYGEAGIVAGTRQAWVAPVAPVQPTAP